MTENRAFMKSMGAGRGIERKEGKYVSNIVRTNQSSSCWKGTSAINHQAAVWCPWRKAPKQGSALVFADGSLAPQTILVSSCLAFIPALVGTLYMSPLKSMGWLGKEIK